MIVFGKERLPPPWNSELFFPNQSFAVRWYFPSANARARVLEPAKLSSSEIKELMSFELNQKAL